MGRTYTFGDAVNVVGPSYNRLKNDDIMLHAVNLALNEVWSSYDWRESIVDLPPFWLYPGEQDYGRPASVIPSDFSGLRTATLVEVGGLVRTPLKVIRGDMDATNLHGLPREIGYNKEKTAFRVFPRTPEGTSSTLYLIDGAYKKEATKITPATIQNTLLPWDDADFATYVATLKWAVRFLNDDPVADQYYGRAQYMIRQMAQQEGLEMGDPTVAPYEPLVA
jgi:hypothetical protein